MNVPATPQFIPSRLTAAEVLARGEIVPLETIPPETPGCDPLLALLIGSQVRWARWPDGTALPLPLECSRAYVVEAYGRARDLREAQLLTGPAFGEVENEMEKPWP